MRDTPAERAPKEPEAHPDLVLGQRRSALLSRGGEPRSAAARALLEASGDLAGTRCPADVAAGAAVAIAATRTGGPEEVLGLPVPGLSSLRPEIAGDIYASLIDEEGKRALGAFYTPPAITHRLARLALWRRPDANVIDPACGAGAFLLSAAAVLYRKMGDECTVSRRLFGIDKDPGALTVCRSILAAYGFHLPEENLVASDALLDAWPRWKACSKGFDAIIGNPPYRNIVRLPADERSMLKARYATFRNKCDLYGLFIEAGARRLAPGGRLAFLVSSSFLGTSSFAPLRSLLFDSEELSARLVEQVKGAPFRDAAVKVATIVADRTRSTGPLGPPFGSEPLADAPLLDYLRSESRPSDRGSSDPSTRFAVVTKTGRRRSCVRVRRSTLRELSRTSAAIPEDPAHLRIAKKMSSAAVPLEQLAEVALGIKTGDDRRFVVRGGRPGREPHFVRCIRGRNVSPWLLRWGEEWLDYRPEVLRAVHGARPRRREHFDRPAKLLVRETSGNRLIAVMDRQRLFPLDTLHSIFELDENKPASLWYLLAVLNSKPASFWYGMHHPGPHVKVAELRALPVPPPVADDAAVLRRAENEALQWIEHSSAVCWHEMEHTKEQEKTLEETCDRPGIPPLPSPPKACLHEGARVGLLQSLAKMLSSRLESTRRAPAQSLVDEIVAAAYGVDIQEMGSRGDAP